MDMTDTVVQLHQSQQRKCVTSQQLYYVNEYSFIDHALLTAHLHISVGSTARRRGSGRGMSGCVWTHRAHSYNEARM